MTQDYRSFGSFILFKEILADELGHLYRAAEISKTDIKRTVFLRLFDSPSLAGAELANCIEPSNRIAGILHAANVAHHSLFFKEGDTVGMAWDYLPAQPLSLIFHKVATEGFPVPVDNALLVLEKLSLGLSAGMAVELEGKSLAHGFLHPSLIVITTDGEAIISGFGMATDLLGVLDDSESASGCLPYLAPEVQLTRTASKRADVYSLGAILYQLLTGVALPEKVEERGQALEQATLSYDGEPIPADIMALLNKTLAPRPEDRFSSASDFKKDLDQLLYGGAYSPTTFNLALFMDRLFRTEAEIEEKEKVAEAEIDVQAFLRPEPEPEPEQDGGAGDVAADRGKGLWIGVAALFAAVILAGVLIIPRITGEKAPLATPTPTPEEIQAQKQAETERLNALVRAEVERRIAEKTEEIRQELTDRQQRIAALQRQLQEAEEKAKAGAAGPTAEEREALKRKIEAEEAQKRQLEAEQARQREEAEAELRRKLAAAEAAKQVATPEPTAVPTSAPQTAAAPPLPTIPLPPTPRPTTVAVTSIPTPRPQSAVVENMFVNPSEVDIQAQMMRHVQPEFSQAALRFKLKGVVIIRATVNASGRVEKAEILRCNPEGFGVPEAALKAAQACVYKPARKNGVKVKTYATITYRFDLSKRG